MAIYPFRPHEKRHFCSNWEWTDFWNTLHPQIYDCKNHRPRFHWTHEINSFQHFDGTIGRLTIDGYSVFWDHFESDSNSKSSGVILTQCTRGLSNGNFIANPEEIQNVLLPRLDHGHLHTGQLSHLFFFSDKRPAWGLILGTQITPRGWIFWAMNFYNLKKFTLRSI